MNSWITRLALAGKCVGLTANGLIGPPLVPALGAAAFANTSPSRIKYANASEVVATLEYGDTDVTLAVKDNGVGFYPDLPVRVDGDKGGFGMISMRERARLLGGELKVESSPGRGTLVEATLPVR